MSASVVRCFLVETLVLRRKQLNGDRAEGKVGSFFQLRDGRIVCLGRGWSVFGGVMRIGPPGRDCTTGKKEVEGAVKVEHYFACA